MRKEIKLYLIWWFSLVLLLSVASFITKPYINRYNDADNDFAHAYATEMLGVIEEMAAEGKELDRRSPEQELDFYLQGEDRFFRLKQAAVHYKGEVAEDFVYALTWAEGWCRYKARAYYKPQDTEARGKADNALVHAEAELQSIIQKDYKAAHAESR